MDDQQIAMQGFFNGIKKQRLWIVACPYCFEVRIFLSPLKDAYWCESEDCRASEKRNGVKALIWEKGNRMSNHEWITVFIDE